jgi:3-methylfumaryl-CoA hydratase
MAATLGRTTTYTEGDVLPPGWQWIYFHDIVPAGSLGPDGHPARGATMPPVPLPRRMWAGGNLRFHAPIILGSTVDRSSTITSITRKKGRSGELYFVEVDHELTCDNEVLVTETQNVVYRELESGSALVTQAAPTGAEESVLWHLDQVALFRFSALTFNSHRIHYDADYARDIEGYPNVVIHGPLLATLLMDLAASHCRVLTDFEYRSRSPLFLPDSFSTNVRMVDDDVALWVAGSDGRLAMDATAVYRQETQR